MLKLPAEVFPYPARITLAMLSLGSSAVAPMHIGLILSVLKITGLCNFIIAILYSY